MVTTHGDIVGAYHFGLIDDDEGTFTGFILYRNEQGNLAWYEGLAEKFAPTQRTQAFSYEYLPPDLDVPLASEDWSGGAGYDSVHTSEGTEVLKRYAFSQGINASYRNKLMLSHRIETALTSTGAAIAGTPTAFYHSPTYGLYALAGRYLYRFDTISGRWVLVNNTGTDGINHKSMREYNSVLVVSAGSNNDYYTSSDGTTFTAFTAEDENADFFETRGAVIWKLKGKTLKNSTNPTASGWSGTDTMGHTSMTPNGLLLASGNLYGLFREGVHEYTGTATSEVWRAPTIRDDNGAQAIIGGDGLIYAPYGGFVMQFDPLATGTATGVYPLTVHLSDPEITGTISALANDERHLYVGVRNASGKTYIMKGDPATNEWDTWVYLDDLNCTSLQWVPEGVAHLTNPCLMVATDGPTAGYIILPRLGADPSTDNNCRFETDGILYAPYWDWGILSIEKFLNEGNIGGEGVTAANTVELLYLPDNDTTAVSLVEATTSGVIRTRVTEEVQFNRLRPVIAMTSGSAHSTPVCYAFSLHATPNPPRKRMWKLTVVLANDLPLTDGQIDVKQDVRYIKDKLADFVDSRVTLVSRDGTTAFVLLREMQGQGIRPVRLGGEERDVEVVELTLVEITQLTTTETVATWGGPSTYGGGHVYGG